ncbi:MAG: T9SS type A sorting domain-containing protein [Bacteroidales bacterium]
MKRSAIFAVMLIITMSVITEKITAQCVQCDANSSASGNYASALGMSSNAAGQASLAAGLEALADGSFSLALGKYVSAYGANSVTIGRYLQTNTSPAMIIGTGYDNDDKLCNGISNSLMIGFNSNKSTLFIGGAPGNDYTGKIGIGDVTVPQAKLHIKADNLEAAEVFIEPHQFGGSNGAALWLGTKEYGFRSRLGKLEFKVGEAGSYIFNDGNLGIGTTQPTARLQVKDGDIFIEDIDRGIIMKSPDGNCWRGTLDNTGALQFNQIDCNSLVGVAAEPDSKQSYKVQIYPNPASNEVTIEYNQSGSAFASFRDLNGALITQRELKTGINRIGLENLSRGYYLLTVMDQSNRVLASEKVMKQ